MKVRLYIDEDAMDGDLVEALRDRGLDVLTAKEAGQVGRPDEQHLRYATEQGRAVYSFNIRDYYRLHTAWLTEGRSHSGLILAQQYRYSIGEQMRRLLRLAAARTPEGMVDQAEFLSDWNPEEA